MNFWLIALSAAGGYVAAIFTWDKVHTFLIGAQAKADALRTRAAALEAKAKSLFGK